MADSPEEARDFDAMNARVYAMSPDDRQAWYEKHPLSMYRTDAIAPDAAVLSLDGSDRSDAAILRAARDVMKRRFGLFTTDIQSSLYAAARHIDEQISKALSAEPGSDR